VSTSRGATSKTSSSPSAFARRLTSFECHRCRRHLAFERRSSWGPPEREKGDACFERSERDKRSARLEQERQEALARTDQERAEERELESVDSRRGRHRSAGVALTVIGGIFMSGAAVGIVAAPALGDMASAPAFGGGMSALVGLPFLIPGVILLRRSRPNEDSETESTIESMPLVRFENDVPPGQRYFTP